MRVLRIKFIVNHASSKKTLRKILVIINFLSIF